MEDKAKQLGDAYLPGAQAALHRYTTLFRAIGETAAPSKTTPAEAVYSEALDELCRLHATVKQGRAYFKRRLDDPDLKPEIDSGIAAWLGHAWQLAELKAAGLVQTDAELMQLAFNSHDDVARREFVETGVWMNLTTGRIHITQNFRPYKAAKYIKSDDSFFQIAQIPELYVYPGDVNPRIRWEGMTTRRLESQDFQRVRESAHDGFAAVVKEIKSGSKSPLADKQPIHALRFARIGRVGESLVVENCARRAFDDDRYRDDGRTGELSFAVAAPPRSVDESSAGGPFSTRPRSSYIAGQTAEHRNGFDRDSINALAA
ncbi:MAG: hypothetical protein QM811_08425 [Pirellulales bacterium]